MNPAEPEKEGANGVWFGLRSRRANREERVGKIVLRQADGEDVNRTDREGEGQSRNWLIADLLHT